VMGVGHLEKKFWEDGSLMVPHNVFCSLSRKSKNHGHAEGLNQAKGC